MIKYDISHSIYYLANAINFDVQRVRQRRYSPKIQA